MSNGAPNGRVNFWTKFVLYLSGLVLGTVGMTYNANPSAPIMAYFAACSTSVGSFLIGTFALNASAGPINPSYTVGPPAREVKS